MFTGLGLVDWIALIVAAVLLAMAVAAIALGMMARNHRRRTPRAVAATSAATAVARSTPPEPETDATVIDLRDDDPARLRATRAQNLRRPPVPDSAPRKPARTAPAPRDISPRIRQPSGRAGFEPRAPGFFDDPIGRHQFRYWDGERWTEHVKEHGERFVDPL